jgi:hypothetical protein
VAASAFCHIPNRSLQVWVCTGHAQDVK